MRLRSITLVLAGLWLGSLLAVPAKGASPAPIPPTSPGVGLTPSSEPQVVLSGRALVPQGVQSGEVVILHGPARVDGQVEGDVIALDGEIVVAGLVNGDVVSLDGSVTVTHSGRVIGDVISEADPVVEEGGQVEGEQHRVSFYFSSVTTLGKLLWWLPVSISALLLGLLMLWLFPRAAEAVLAAVKSRPVASAGWGIVIAIVLPVLGIFATATLVGIPLGLALLLSMLLIYLAGYVWAAWILGRLLLPSRTVLAFAAGWAILRVVALIPFVGGPAALAAFVYGTGAVSVAVWRARSSRSRGRHARTGYDPGAMTEIGSN